MQEIDLLEGDEPPPPSPVAEATETQLAEPASSPTQVGPTFEILTQYSTNSDAQHIFNMLL